MFCTECGGSLSSGQKFCGACGTKVSTSGLTNANSYEDNPNRGDNFSHYAHALNAIIGTKFNTIDQVLDYGQSHLPELSQRMEAGDSEARLILAVIACADGDSYTEAYKLAKKALDAAISSGLDAGRYWFGYGYALEQIESFDDALEAHEKAVQLGFGAAAFNLGRIIMNYNLDLVSAVRIWKVGRDKFNDYICKEMLEDSETSPGVYRAQVTNPDGSVEILMASDNPGGLGTFK